jgi:hypothetical protein
MDELAKGFIVMFGIVIAAGIIAAIIFAIQDRKECKQKGVRS